MGMLLFVTGCSSDDSGDSEPVAPDASPQDFVFEKKENRTAALVAYTGRALSVDIPSKVDDCLVTSIGKTDGSGNPVFKNHTEISELNMPSSIHYIGAESFRNTGLTWIAVPAHVQYIGKDCFKVWGQNVMDEENGLGAEFGGGSKVVQ